MLEYVIIVQRYIGQKQVKYELHDECKLLLKSCFCFCHSSNKIQDAQPIFSINDMIGSAFHWVIDQLQGIGTWEKHHLGK